MNYKKISFNDETKYSRYVDYQQELLLPEGAGQGQEWWNWFKSALGVFGGAFGIILGITSLVLKVSPILNIVSIVLSVLTLVNDIYTSLNSGNVTLIPSKIFDDANDVKKIYNRIMENSLNLYDLKEINWENLSTNYLSTYVNDKLLGEAWSTAIFGQYSRMSLYTVWGTMNADIKYLIYSNK